MMRAYNAATDYKTIAKWHRLPAACLPKYGLYVPDIAVGFLMQTDTNFCFLEPFIGNPEKTKEERDVALYDIMHGLLDAAKKLNYDIALGIISAPTMLVRAEKCGFLPLVGANKLVGRRLT